MKAFVAKASIVNWYYYILSLCDNDEISIIAIRMLIRDITLLPW